MTLRRPPSSRRTAAKSVAPAMSSVSELSSVDATAADCRVTGRDTAHPNRVRTDVDTPRDRRAMSSDEEAPMGPVEVLVVEFPGNRFTGDIAPAITELEDAGVVNVLDLVFVSKDADGHVSWFELSDCPARSRARS